MPKKAVEPPRANRGKFTIVEIDGRIAMARGDRYVPDRPAREYWYNVSPHRVTDDNRHLIGKDLTSENAVSWYEPLRGWRNASMVGWSDWPERTIVVDIPSPRNGREYGWKWQPDRQYSTQAVSDGSFKNGWVKEPFPRCAACYASVATINDKRVTYTNYHDPSFVYVESCDRCHAGGVCDEKGICAPG